MPLNGSASPFQHLSLSLLKPNWKSVYFHSILLSPTTWPPCLAWSKIARVRASERASLPPAPSIHPLGFTLSCSSFLSIGFIHTPCIPSFSSLCLSILLGHTFLSPSHGCSACRNITLGRVRGGGATGRGRRRGGEGWGRTACCGETLLQH